MTPRFDGWQAMFRGEAPAQPPVRPGHRFDGWFNVLHGLNTRTYDKRYGTQYCAEIISYPQAREIWRGDDLGARAVEVIPKEMLRQGYELNFTDKKLQEKLSKLHQDLGVVAALQEALFYERAYGGGAILLGAQDNAVDWGEPLNEDAIREFNYLTVLEPRELMVQEFYNDPRQKKFGQPKIYSLTPISAGGVVANAMAVRIHESRLVVFPGIRVSRQQLTELSGWGDNVFTRANPVLRDFNLSWSSAGILVTDFAQAVYKIEGLAELIGLDKDEEVLTRIRIAEMSRSSARAMMIDSQDEFERKQTPISGLPEMLDKFMTRLAAALEMPLTMLMGTSPGGMNATGESDMRIFYDRIKAMQVHKLAPVLQRITTLLMRANGMAEPPQWDVEFCPLWQPTQKEQAETRFITAQSDAIYIQNGVISAEEAAESRFAGGKWSMETNIDFANRAALEPPAAAPPPGDGFPPDNSAPAPDKSQAGEQ